jgi:hypothetical protein
MWNTSRRTADTANGDSYINVKCECSLSESLSVCTEEHVWNDQTTNVSRDFQNEMVPVIPTFISCPAEQFTGQESLSLIWNNL